MLISGLPTVDIEDLKTNTEYHKYQVNSLQVAKYSPHLAQILDLGSRDQGHVHFYGHELNIFIGFVSIRAIVRELCPFNDLIRIFDW